MRYSREEDARKAVEALSWNAVGNTFLQVYNAAQGVDLEFFKHFNILTFTSTACCMRLVDCDTVYLVILCPTRNITPLVNS